MVTSLLSGIAGKLLGELCSPLLQDVGKYWVFGAKDEFKKLTDTLSAIEAVLLDAEEKQKTNHQVQDWLKKITIVFYDVEDLLLDISTEALKRQVMTKNKRAKKVHIFFSRLNQVKYRVKMGRRVKLMRERLDAIASDRNRFNFTERQEEMPVIRKGKRKDETHSFVPLGKVIGREDERKCITKLLLEADAENNVSVISIIGIGGSGKSTLAQSVYSVEEIKENFDLKMWVCVSDDFDIRVVCEKIIESATMRKSSCLQIDGVQKELKDAIDGRKYLLVLDDIWNESPIEWMKLEELLVGGSRGSKILITARVELVARAAKSVATHFLKGLSHEESWLLFKQVTFKHGVEPASSTIVGIGKEVVGKCAGVPLAIKTIGSMLSLKEKEDDWLDFKTNDLPRMTQDSEGDIVSILKLSYDYLSAPLKRCFAYCAVFPKDQEIDKSTLILIWIAQGLIQLDGTTRSLEDVGEKHFMNLLDRSFFEIYDKYHNGWTFLYKMHDLIHDLAQSIGGNECFTVGSDVNNVDETTLHAWVPRDMLTNLFHAKKLRTLVVKAPRILDEFPFNEDTSKFKHMRVLYLSYIITSVPRFVSELRQLTYLNLSGSTFELLPESICSLYNLQTLILTWCKKLKELPTGTRNLVSLRHLDIGFCNKLSHMPCGLGELTSLQKLSDFITGPQGRNCGELGELKSLVNLRGALKIHLRASKVVKSKKGQSGYPHLLTQLKSLQYLELEWSYRGEVEAALLQFESLKPHPNLAKLFITRYGGTRFPSWMDKGNIGISLGNIGCIVIDQCNSCQNVPPFGLLPYLRELTLKQMSVIDYMHDDSEEDQGQSLLLFPSLKLLSLRDLPRLTGVFRPSTASFPKNNNQHFPVLEKLDISNCPLFMADGRNEVGKLFLSLREVILCDLRDIETLPTWLQHLLNLQTLELIECDDIVTLPGWMTSLTSLEEIRLSFCDSLASIPDCMRLVTSLKRLEVIRCPKLLPRCEKEVGEDWHNIAHISNISLR